MEEPRQVIVVQQDKTLIYMFLTLFFVFICLPVGLCCGGAALVQISAGARQVIRNANELEKDDKEAAEPLQP